MEWGYEKSLLANKLDAVSSLTFENYGLQAYYSSKNNWQAALDAMEEVPTPSFHWWNFHMGSSFHFLGDKDRARSYYNVVKEAYGENAIEMLGEGVKMWNYEPLFHRFNHLTDEYSWK